MKSFSSFKVECNRCHLQLMGKCPYTKKTPCIDGHFATYYSTISNLPEARISEVVKYANLTPDLDVLLKYIDEAVNDGFTGVIKGIRSGLGLTTFGINLLNYYFTKISITEGQKTIYGSYLNMIDYLNAYRLYLNGNLHNEALKLVIENISNIPLIVIDSFGLTAYNDYDLQIINSFLDLRKNSKKCTILIIASNINTKNDIYNIVKNYRIFNVENPLWE